MYDIIPYGDGISIDKADCSHRLINVTEMFKASGAPEHKRPVEWFRQEQTQELVEELLKWAETTSITETRKGTTEGGQRGGGSTWYCEELALAYAMYLSPALHLACLRFILDSQRQPQQPAASTLSREDVRQMIQEELKSTRVPPHQDDYLALECNRETIAALKALGGISSVKPLALYLNVSRNTAQKRLLRLAKRGAIQRINYGLYGLSGDNNVD
jgi:hypothetical protein